MRLALVKSVSARTVFVNVTAGKFSEFIVVSCEPCTANDQWRHNVRGRLGNRIGPSP